MTAAPVRTSARRAPAFSLIELTLVLVILGLLMGVVVIAVGPQVEAARRRTTAVTMRTLQGQITSYSLSNAEFPPNLTAIEGMLEGGIPKDAWKQPFYYRVNIDPTAVHPYELVSSGKDKELDTEDDLNIWDPELQDK